MKRRLFNLLAAVSLAWRMQYIFGGRMRIVSAILAVLLVPACSHNHSNQTPPAGVTKSVQAPSPTTFPSRPAVAFEYNRYLANEGPKHRAGAFESLVGELDRDRRRGAPVADTELVHYLGQPDLIDDGGNGETFYVYRYTRPDALISFGKQSKKEWEALIIMAKDSQGQQVITDVGFNEQGVNDSAGFRAPQQ
jgi:hypothetical protein